MESAARREGASAFLREALAPLFTRAMVVPVLLLTLLLTATNIVLASHVPPDGRPPPLTFILAGFVRVAGLLVLAVAILRRLTASPRPPWKPDGAFWLYVLTLPASLGVAVAVASTLGQRTDPAGLFARTALTAAILAPLAAWFVAIAAARPLAFRPGAWLRDFGRWLPSYLLWTILLVAPLAALHAWLDEWLVRGAGDHFWPIALLDGPLSVVVAMLGFGLTAAAYRRVAQR
jgi:succinate dehydrogenase hydrophobic anchor subunit